MCLERGGIWEITRPTAIARFKMEDAYNLYNVIEFFCQGKLTKTKRGRPFGLFKLQMALAQLFKTYLHVYVDIQICMIKGVWKM